jgi:hypothetical protein
MYVHSRPHELCHIAADQYLNLEVTFVKEENQNAPSKTPRGKLGTSLAGTL